ncbi:MAG: hypothetical protein QM601_11260, partial [Pseudoxanthomonas sp.]
QPPPAPVPAAAPAVAPAQRMAEVQAAAAGDDRELDVQPLRDPQVEDLRQAAQAARTRGDLGVAGDDLNQALMISPEDPALLQERAEVALLQGEWERAEALARKAVQLGSKTGPLCRRHWATIEQSQLARGQDLNAASAHAQIAACTVAGVQRY